MKKYIILTFVMFMMMTNVFAKELKVKDGEMNFVMDAPIEMIKGKTNAVSGSIHIDGDNLKSASGSIEIDLSKIKTFTFQDAEKNETQNEHLWNWLEISDGVKPALQNKYKKATLSIHGAKKVTKTSDTQSTLVFEGDLTVHGITKKVPVILSIEKTERGHVAKTVQPILLGLSDHDIRPRDFKGRLLQKTLETLSDKVAQQAQVSVSVRLQ